MSAEIHGSATLQFSPDERLAAAAGGVVRYFADTAGMEADAVAKLQAATLAVCLAAFAHFAKTSPPLTVEITRFADRIEVVISPASMPPEKLAALPGVDRIEQESRNGAMATRLTKTL
ncbi:MAG TPA: hypothetical protein VKF79_03800 [Candidatus Acidoferrum sp.]|nr:hypothetical protein [Candidatus Acidoferrum sp.]